MASFSHHDRYHPQPRPRYDSHYSDQYSRPLRHDPRPDDHAPAMRDRANPYSSSPSSSSYTSYEPRYSDSPVPPRPSSRYPPTSAYRPSTRHTQSKPWPPPPSVEDELSSLGKEFPSLAGSDADHGRGGEVKSRGSVDQYPIIEEIEQPHIPYDNDDRRFVLVSDPGADGVEPSASTPRRDHRRKSVAERGNMAHLKTDMADPPVFTERTSTPYAYTKPQKESLLPSPDEYSLSPEATHTSASSVPRSVPSRDQNATHTKAIPIHSRYDSFTQSQAQSPRAHRNDVFDDSDPESEGTTHLRTERKPARYSFVKSDLQKEDLRTSLHESQSRSDKKRQDAAASNSRGTYSGSSSSSKHSSPPYQSPRSSSSSLEDGGRRKARPPPVDPGMRDSRPSPRPSSPRYHEPPQIPPRSPKLPPRRPVDSPTTSRPPSRSGIRPPSPLSSSTTFTPTSVPRVPVTETDWHSTYPPVSADRPRPPSRLNRHDSLPVPNPRIDVQSPSPARPPPRADNPLPYPVDDRPRDVYMPPEEKYQFDHSSTPVTASPRQPFLDSPKLTPSPAPVSPRERPAGSRPSTNTRHSTNPEEIPRLARVRSNSIRSQSSHDGRRTERRTGPIPLSMDKPLPSCPRSEPSDKYDDWYMLENRANFDICPSCFEAVFEDTPFSVYFSQTRRYERRQDRQQRVCDFSSPWLRLAWLMTLRQRRKGFELIYAMADILETERPCPMDREISTDVCMWYGIPDLRDGLHISNFAVCPRDLKMIEALFPTVRGYFTPLPSTNALGAPNRHKCSLRTSSRRFPKYLDLLVELDTDAQTRSLHPDMARFIQLARENAFKQECNKGTPAFRKPWHFIPQLPHLTVCQECYDELVWPILKSKSTHPSSNIPNMFNRAIQLVPGEDPDAGSSCCLWSPRMRKVWAKALEYDDFKYLSRKAIERKGKDIELARERRELVEWMAGAERQSREWETGRRELRKLDAEWADFE